MGTIKADSIQPTIAGNNLILRTGSDVERVRIGPTGDINVSGNISTSGKITSASITGSDSSTTLTTKGYVDAIFNPQIQATAAGYTRIGNFVMQFGFMPLSSMVLENLNNYYAAVTFPITYTQGPWTVQVTPRFTVFNSLHDISGQALSPSLTGVSVVINGAGSGVTAGLTGAYWFAIGTA